MTGVRYIPAYAGHSGAGGNPGYRHRRLRPITRYNAIFVPLSLER